jgi:hypothetical protein
MVHKRSPNVLIGLVLACVLAGLALIPTVLSASRGGSYEAKANHCYQDSNAAVVAEHLENGTWSYVARIDNHTDASGNYPLTDALGAEVANGKLYWVAKGDATICWAQVSVRSPGARTGTLQPSRVISQPRGNFVLPAHADGVVLRGYVPGQGDGPGVSETFSQRQLDTCRDHANVRASIARTNPKQYDSPWGPSTAELLSGNRPASKTTAVKLSASEDRVAWRVARGVVVCRLLFQAAGESLKPRPENQSSGAFGSQGIPLVLVRVLAYDPSKPNGPGIEQLSAE